MKQSAKKLGLAGTDVTNTVTRHLQTTANNLRFLDICHEYNTIEECLVPTLWPDHDFLKVLLKPAGRSAAAGD